MAGELRPKSFFCHPSSSACLHNTLNINPEKRDSKGYLYLESVGIAIKAAVNHESIRSCRIFYQWQNCVWLNKNFFYSGDEKNKSLRVHWHSFPSRYFSHSPLTTRALERQKNYSFMLAQTSQLAESIDEAVSNIKLCTEFPTLTNWGAFGKLRHVHVAEATWTIWDA